MELYAHNPDHLILISYVNTFNFLLFLLFFEYAYQIPNNKSYFINFKFPGF